MSNYLTDEEYDFIYSRSPRICVDLLIVNSKKEVLLTKRDIEPYKDHWHFPGGRIKFRERAEDAIKRIIKGELGIELAFDPQLVGFCQFLEEVQKGQDRHSISLVHLIELTDDVEIKLDNTAKDVRFFKDLPSPIIPPQHEFLLTQGWK